MVQQLEVDIRERHDLLRSCPGMTDLVSWLDSIDRRPGLNELEVRLTSNQYNLDALRKGIRSTDDGYQRNVIKRTDHYELVAICWRPVKSPPFTITKVATAHS